MTKENIYYPDDNAFDRFYKRARYQAYADRALEALDAYLATRSDLFGGDRS